LGPAFLFWLKEEADQDGINICQEAYMFNVSETRLKIENLQRAVFGSFKLQVSYKLYFLEMRILS
jgi:hypothetical protein